MEYTKVHKRGIRMVEKIDELKNIQECIENNNNFLLSGGAGSGKTYSLVQTINFIKENYNV